MQRTLTYRVAPSSELRRSKTGLRSVRGKIEASETLVVLRSDAVDEV